MKKTSNWLFGLLLFVGLMLGTQASAAEMNFSVRAVLPENQVDKNSSYFDLKMRPNQSQELELKLTNGTEQALTVTIGNHTATTNDNGIADYSGGTAKKKEDSLPYDISELITSAKEVTIPAKGETIVKVQVNMPSKAFDGVLLGGLTFAEKENDNTKEQQKGVSVVNKYAYTIGVQLRETETEVKPELVLQGVSPAQVNFRNVIQAEISNTKAAIIKDLAIDGKITKKNNGKVLYEAKRSGLRMAPNSTFNYGISLNNEAFKPGTYTFKGTATAGDQRWTFEKDFTIQGEKAKALNNQAVELEKDYSAYIYLGIGLLVLILVGIIFYLLKKTKNNVNE